MYTHIYIHIYTYTYVHICDLFIYISHCVYFVASIDWTVRHDSCVLVSVYLCVGESARKRESGCDDGE